jgi:hypothetical protein
MQVNVTAPAVIRRQMEHDFYVTHGLTGDTGLAQIGACKFYLLFFYVMLDVLQPAAGEVVHHPHACAGVDKRMDEIGSNEGCPAGD